MINNVVLVGNLTKAPELRSTSNGISTCTMTVAVNRPQRDGQSKAEYIPVVVWRQIAENCAKYLTKGSKVGVTGSLQTRNYESDGRKVYVMEVLADTVDFLTPKGQTAEAENVPHYEAPVKPTQMVESDDGDLPF